MMKYILTFILLFAVTTVSAATAEKSPFEGKHDVKPIVYTECRAGQLFVIAASRYGVTIMQIFQDAGDMVPKPIECDE